MNRTRDLCVILHLIMLFGFVFTLILYIPQNYDEKSDLHSSASGVRRTLYYGEYHLQGYTLNEKYVIEWSFTSENPNGGIKVIVMNKINYYKFLINDSNYEHFLISDGNRVKDEGVFRIPFENDWYIIFLNDYSSTEPIYLHAMVGTSDNIDLLIFLPILITCGILLFIGVTIIFYKIRRKKLPDDLYCCLCILPLVLLVYYFMTPSFSYLINYGVKYPNNNTYGLRLSSYNDYERYGIPGSGTKEDPFIIENRTILTHSGYAIDIDYSTYHIIIRNNILCGASGAINLYCRNSSYIEIANNLCIGSRSVPRGHGISLYTSNNHLGTRVISNNTLINFYDGIYISNNPNSTIKNNIIKFVQEGVHIYRSEGTEIANNTIIYKKGYFHEMYDAISIYSRNCSVKNNHLLGSGIHIPDYILSNISLENNRINGKELGFFRNSNNLNFTDSDHYGQLYFINCNNTTLENLNFSKINYAVSLYNCTSSNITKIQLNNSLGTAVCIFNCRKVNVTECVFNSNLEGAYIYESNFIDFYNNYFYNNRYGISIYFSNCTYVSNEFIDNEVNWRVFTN